MEESDEVDHFALRRQLFRGSAKIRLDCLFFEDDPYGEFVDPKNVTRLIQIFELEGCLRLDIEHHIPVLIEQDLLEECIAQTLIDPAKLLNGDIVPELELPPNTKLNCLHGRHRIAAARKFLLPVDRWWTVDLYLESLYFVPT